MRWCRLAGYWLLDFLTYALLFLGWAVIFGALGAGQLEHHSAMLIAAVMSLIPRLMLFPSSLEFKRTVEIAEDRCDPATALTSYWRTRGFELAAGDSGELYGERVIPARDTSFQYMRRMPAQLHVAVSSGSTVQITMTVDVRFQVVTDVHRAYFRLEMVECQSVLQRGQILDEMWSSFAKFYRSHPLLLTQYLGKLPPDWEECLARLEASET